MTMVACVLRSGGDFSPAWVRALSRGIRDMVCLSDVIVDGVHCVPLEHPWPRWWAKIELFRPELRRLSDCFLYLDLDTLVLGDLDSLLRYDGDFAMLAGFLESRRGKKVGQSGVMAWTPGPHTDRLYETFAADPNRYMRRYRGDADYIRAHVHHDYLQDRYSGIYSYKLHARNGPPRGAVLICGHGRPRFSDPRAGWAHERWKAA
jgi:hypothetical protein